MYETIVPVTYRTMRARKCTKLIQYNCILYLVLKYFYCKICRVVMKRPSVFSHNRIRHQLQRACFCRAGHCRNSRCTGKPTAYIEKTRV